MFRPKEHKQLVPCAIGFADSGKTSLFAPVFQIVPLNRIARVTKQKSFNKAMIDNSTEIIVLDEAFPGLLEIDDWKILCQEGFTSHDVKWKKAGGFHCNASMDSPKSRYIVKIETLGDPNIEGRLIYSSCHSEGINITDLEEYTKYCVYVTTFNEYGKANSSSCIVAVTGEKGILIRYKPAI